MGNVVDVRREMTKTKEQLEEEKKISLSIRIRPLELDGIVLCFKLIVFYLMIYKQEWTKMISNPRPRSCGIRL